MPNTTVKLHPDTWNYLKNLTLPPGRFVWHSCRAKMVPNPGGSLLPPIPWIERPGRTARRTASEKQYLKWRKTRRNLKWIQHLMEMPSEYSE